MPNEPQRLDEAGALLPYVNTTSAWVHRCAERMLELDPDLDALAAMHTVDDMATSSRWRLMLPRPSPRRSTPTIRAPARCRARRDTPSR